MNSDKMSNSMNMANISNQGMSNANFLSLAGLMAAAGRNMGGGSRFMGPPQPPFPNPIQGQAPPANNDTAAITTMAMTMAGLLSDSASSTAPAQTPAAASCVATSGHGGATPAVSASATSQASISTPPMHQSLTRPPFPGFLNNIDWSWVEAGQNPESINSLLERGRSRNWTYEETLELISMYTSQEWQDKFANEKKNHRAIWVSLAASLTKRKDVSGDEARQRLNNLKAFYNRIRRQLLGGEIAAPQWEYWDPLHAFLGRPQPYLPLPPAAPIPQFPASAYQNFQQNFQSPNGFCRSSSDASPYGHFQNVPPQTTNSTRPLFEAFGIPNIPAALQGNAGNFSKSNRSPNRNESRNKGEDVKSETSQNALNAATQLFLGDMSASLGGDQQPSQPSEDNSVPVPLSPEQYLSEENDPATLSASSPVIGQRPESYKLKHNNHLHLVLESLAGDESFMDVTLTAQGRAIKAHKSVLSAVSPYFRSVLKENPCQHPIIIMPRDIRFEELNSIISYIYKGEMTVATEDLGSLLKTAEVLQVTGLTPPESGSAAPGSFMTQIHSGLPVASAPSKASRKSSKKQSTSASVDASQRPPEEPQPAQWFNDSSAHNAAAPDTRIDPQDFLSADMTCVKEEIHSDGEEEFETPSYKESQSEPNTVDTPPLQMDTSASDLQESRSQPPADDPDPEAPSKQFRPGEGPPDSPSSTSSACSLNAAYKQPFVCPHCLESHRPFSSLQSHLKLKHPTKPSFACHCGAVFVRQHELSTHSKVCTAS